ncbi:MAG TPA: hypothetical protein PKK12_10840, partial [Candidatus Aminicenantes bacterium]|nr:hypothetical protein [Candidatus Aminicenantes bacterium]
MSDAIALADIKINYPLVQRFPPDFLIKNLFFPLTDEDGALTVAMADPGDLDKISIIENFAQKRVIAHRADREEIEKILKKSDAFTQVLKDKTETFVLKKSAEAAADETITLESVGDEDDSIVKLLNNV